MSNIIKFPKQRGTKADRARHEAAIREANESAGGAAAQKLGAWRRYIPMNDRLQLARNMERLFSQYDIKTSDLPWFNDEREYYGSIEEFRRDVHRMRLPEDAPPGRRLIARPEPWLRLLKYVNTYLTERGLNEPLELLADRLTRGSRFHPTRTAETDAGKLFYLLNRWANELDSKHSLLRTFQAIAAYRAEYFRLHLRDIDNRYDGWHEVPDCMNMKVSDWHEPTSDRRGHPFNKPLGDLTLPEWDEVIDLVGSENHIFNLYRDEIVNWKRHTNKNTSLCTADSEAVLTDDTALFPHWFVGYIAYDDILASARSKHWLSKIIEREGTGDPLALGHDNDWQLPHGYLVLYPTVDQSRIVPYLFLYQEEGSNFYPLREEDLLEQEDAELASGFPSYRFFKPEGVGETVIARSLLARVKESRRDIYDSWNKSSVLPGGHPYIKWHKAEEKALDDDIADSINRTDRIVNEEDR